MIKERDKKKVIIDCDTGTDDAVAVAALLLADNIDVIGITTVHGNISVDCSTDNNLQLLSFLGKEVPVYKGCNEPLVKNLQAGAGELIQTTKKEFGGEMIGIHMPDIELCKHHRQAEEQHAVFYLVETLKNATEPIDICAIGPLTNLGAAFRIAPEIAKNIGCIYIMGGGLYMGNRTPMAEANFVDDPEAAEIVLTSGAKILLSPIEANVAGATYGLKDIEEIEAIGNELSRFIGLLIRKFIWRCGILWEPGFEKYPKFEFPEDMTCCIHDWAAVAPIIDPSTVTEQKSELCHVDISRGISQGQLVVDRRGYMPNVNVDIVYDMDEKKTKQLLLDLIRAAAN